MDQPSRLTFLIAATVTLLRSVLASQVQSPLGMQPANASLLIDQLKIASIIPDVLDPFTPKVTLSLFWTNATAEVGDTLEPARLQQAPDAQFINHVPFLMVAPVDEEEKRRLQKMQLTLAMTDPDAPSRQDPKWSEICLWIATDVQITDPDAMSTRDGFSRDPETIVPYKVPAPSAGTGKHRYTFVALAPANGTTERLCLRKPGDRRRWGYRGDGKGGIKGLRDWAKDMGMEVIGANFIYAQYQQE